MTSAFEEATIERNGALAAARGLGWQANPYLRRENMPVATGEPLNDWSRKHDAWQRGFEGRIAARGGASPRSKQALPPGHLASMVEERLRCVPAVAEALRDDVAAVPRLREPRSHARDARGRDWDVEGFECRGVDARACEAEFRRIVDDLRDRYDLA